MNIFISGGTSGIGWGLALKYLNDGNKVAVCGRNKNKVDQKYLDQYPNLTVYEVDVSNKEMLNNAVIDFSQNDLHMMIASAGVYENSRKSVISKEKTNLMIETNIIGTINAFEIARKLMMNNEKGHIVAISSVAGLLKSYPGASTYSNTKKIIMQLCDSYAKMLRNFNINVTVIAPGYINTDKLKYLNDGDASHKMFLMELDEAIKIITSGLEQKKEKIIFPLKMNIIIKILNILPEKLRSKILLPSKNKQKSNDNE